MAGDPCIGCQRPLLQGRPDGGRDGSERDLLDGRCGTCRLLYSTQRRVPQVWRGHELEGHLRSKLRRIDQWLAEAQTPATGPNAKAKARPGVIPGEEEQILTRQRSRSPRQGGAAP